MKLARLFVFVYCSLCLCACSKPRQDASVVSSSSSSHVLASSSERVEVNPPMDPKTAARLLIAEAKEVVGERTEANPPMDAETAAKLLITKEADKKDEPVSASKGERHLLGVPPMIQRVWHYCAPTTVSMMVAYKGISVDQTQLAQEMGTYEPFGTHNRDAIRILNQHLFGYEVPAANQAGYRLATITTADPHSEELRLFKERLKKNIADGYPMYYTFDVSKVYPGKKGVHNVVGIGYRLNEAGTDIATLYYLDPSPNEQDSVYGGLKIISPEELFQSMLTCEEPNYAW